MQGSVALQGRPSVLVAGPPPEARGWHRGVKLIFIRGGGVHISLVVAFKGPNVTLGLYKRNYSLPKGKELGAAAG